MLKKLSVPFVCLALVGSTLGAAPVAAQSEPIITGEGFSGDFNGDSKMDVANFDVTNGAWRVGLSIGTRFNTSQWADYATTGGWTHRIGDFDGDNSDDVFSFKDGTGRMVVGLSVQTHFEVSDWRDLEFDTGWQTWIVGDYDGDGDDDVAGYRKSNETWYAFISDGQSFTAAQAWSSPATAADWSHLGGDFNGDGKADVASFGPGQARWRVGLSDGAKFSFTDWADLTPDDGWGRKRTGDFDGNGRDDIANFYAPSAEWRVSKSQGDNSFSTTKWTDLSPDDGWGDAVVGDYNGDGKDDIATFLAPSARWYVSVASGPTSFTSTIWGDLSPNSGWQDHVGGDFNGDGWDDLASFHAPTGRWWVSLSQQNSFATSDWNPDNLIPHASFTFECQGLDCQFHDTSTDPDGTISSRIWNFGDGSSSAEKDPTHSYANAGTYTVTLLVTDDRGSQDNESRTVSVEEVNAAPTARFKFECNILKCTFKDNSMDPEKDIRLYSWDFNDGETSNKKDPVHVYDKGGTYIVTHTVTDNAGQTSSVERKVLVLKPHRRRVGTDLTHIQGYLYAKGKLRVADGFIACRSGRDIVVQKKVGSRWIKVVKGRSRRSGEYLIPLYYNNSPHDRPGTYRVKAPRERPGTRPGHVCLADVSTSRTHSH